jgi:hypothetical protein
MIGYDSAHEALYVFDRLLEVACHPQAVGSPSMTPHDQAPQQIPLLSKSRYMAGLQCVKRLYIESYDADFATPSGPGREALFAAGTTAGMLAQQLYPGGVLVDEDYRHHREATTRTKALLRDATIGALYEAAFVEDDIRIRADILVRSNGAAWNLVEVKSSTSVKDQYIDDVAVQLHVLAHAGVRVNRASIAYINTQYVYEGGPHVVRQLFTVEDVTDLARSRLTEVPVRLAEMRAALATDIEPSIDIGAHCTKPYGCQFIAYCRRNEPEWPIDELPGIRSTRVDELRAAGYRSLATLPGSIALNPMQQRVRDAVQSQQPWVSDDLTLALDNLTYPAHFIDFETVGPWLPRWVGTRPYQTLPFQWSDHTLHEDGALEHAEFLADGTDDPRWAFATSLIERLQDTGTLVVYTGYERQQLTALRDGLLELAPELNKVLSIPQFDLHQVLRSGYYHPGFLGSFSLKAVLPVMVPELAYTDLAIQHGDVASLQFQKLLDDDLDDATRSQISADLLAYCERDSLAMVRIVEALREVPSGR